MEMKVINSTNWKGMNPRLFKVLVYMGIIKDFVVQDCETLYLCTKYKNKYYHIPLHKDADILELSGKVGEAAGRIFDKGKEWTVFPFQRKYKGHVYSGATAQLV